MMVRSGNPALWLGTLMSAGLLLLGAGGTGRAQSAPPSLGVQEQGPQAAPPLTTPAPSPPAGEENPGLIKGLSNLFDKVPSFLPPIKSPSETMNDLSRLATPSTMVSGRAACPVSSNGAPDCKPAANQLCQSKGYTEGRSLNTDSAEKCSAKVLIPGRQRKADDCHTDTVVTSALCQN